MAILLRSVRYSLYRAAPWKSVVAVCLISAATALPASAQTFNSLASFDGTNGYSPIGQLVQGTDGNLYGVANYGGAISSYGGTVFTITPNGTLQTLYSFCTKPNCIDGAEPSAALVLGTDANFYGSTWTGGTYQDGTIFKITSSGKLRSLYSFDGTDGANPYAPLVEAPNGNLYGTTYDGGLYGDGTVFRISPTGVLTTLHSFDGSDGSQPVAALVVAPNGNLYGTTYAGGLNNAGTIFDITSSGTFTSLYAFDVSDGQGVQDLVQAASGVFYGTTLGGGDYDNGTVFEFTPAGGVETLFSFGGTDGTFPVGLVQGTDGNLYGTTNAGGANGSCSADGFVGCGTEFEITPAGVLTTLYNFCSQAACTDGDQPLAARGSKADFHGSGTGAVCAFRPSEPRAHTLTRDWRAQSSSPESR